MLFDERVQSVLLKRDACKLCAELRILNAMLIREDMRILLM